MKSPRPLTRSTMATRISGSSSVTTRHRGERGREAELEKAQDLHRDRDFARPGEEDRQVDVGERMDEREHGAGDDAAS